MANSYPRSLPGPMVLGSTMAMLPLLAAIGYASLALEDFTRSSEEVVRQRGGHFRLQLPIASGETE